MGGFGVLNQATEAINEGRHAVRALRSSTVVTNDLAQAIAVFWEELLSDRNAATIPGFRVEIEGTSRDLVPLIRDEVHRIVVEALRNAFQHASASQVEVDILYGRRQLEVQVRDDGTGIDQRVVAAGGREGHFGLAGMRERAEVVGGKLTIWSRVDSGTEVDLKIPGVLAYAKTKRPKHWGLFNKKS